MRAVCCIDHGPPIRLEVADVSRPQLSEGHIRVAVKYCALGVPDLLVMNGNYQVKPELPFIPGCEVAGIVTEVGPGTTGVQVGARVAGLNYTFVGGLAEEAVMPIAATVVLPDAVPLRIASAMLVNYATSYYALKDRGDLRPDETVLVLGAAGGVGLAAIEIAKHLGARVLAAASTDEKLSVAKRHGADDCLNYADGRITDELKSYGGVDVVVDPVGGVYSEQALRALRPGGRLLVIGFAAGEIRRIALNLPLLKDCSIVGAFLGAQTRDYPERFVANMTRLFDLYLEGCLSPEITEFDCFEDFLAALHYIENRDSLGKVVMRVTAVGEGSSMKAAGRQDCDAARKTELAESV